MSRVWRLNRDIDVSVGIPTESEERYEVFLRYLESQHDRLMGRSREAFADFLYDSPTETLEFAYRRGPRLIGVSIADRIPSGLSSVYMYFDPAFARQSVGTYSILWEIEYARKLGLPHYYLWYYVAESDTMSYKARFRPNEMLVADNHWIRLGE
jgi:arginine-tRNA-protein transferase